MSRRLPWLAVVAGVVAMVIGWVPAAPSAGVVPLADPAPARAAVPVAGDGSPPAGVVPVSGDGRVPAGVLPGSPSNGVVPGPAVEPGTAEPPQRVLLPDLGVDADVIPVGVDPGGALQVPPDPDVVGWWHDGAAPGAPAGTVVLAGHVDTRADGPGALFRIAELRPGQPVLLHTAGGELRYVVRAVRSYPKTQLPPEVFARSGTPRLVLISCGGAFDRRLRHYADNIVVYAVPQEL